MKLEVSDCEWSTVLEYWKDLQKHLNDRDDDKKKIEFLNHVIFESAGLKKSLHSQCSIKTTTTINKTKEAVVAVYDKYTKFDDDIKIDSKMKTFIVEPV